MAFSPANCSLVQISEDWQIKWHNLEYALGDPATISDGWLLLALKLSIVQVNLTYTQDTSAPLSLVVPCQLPLPPITTAALTTFWLWPGSFHIKIVSVASQTQTRTRIHTRAPPPPSTTKLLKNDTNKHGRRIRCQVGNRPCTNYANTCRLLR